MTAKSAKHVLVVGADATLGRSLSSAYEEMDIPLWKTTRQQSHAGPWSLFLDLSEDMAQWPLPRESIGVAFLCAAVTSQKLCQLEPEFTRKINVSGTVVLARRLVEAGAFIVFPSTNLVFDGGAPFMKSEDIVTPQTEYGRQKAEAESQLLQLGNRIAIVRFSKIIAPGMPLLMNWIHDLKAGKSIHPFSDMMMAPISLTFATNVLCHIAENKISGITQMSAANDVTYAECARYIARKLCIDPDLIEPISYKESGIHFSPQHTTLDSTRLVEFGLPSPPPLNAIDQLLSLTSS